MKRIFIITLFAASLSTAAFANSELPKLPYYDWGACPFECCTYQEWEAVTPVALHEAISKKSKIAFQVKEGERVQGVTGVVITYEYGKTKILKPIKAYLPKDNQQTLILKPGETVYTLHYVGEGYDLFWYKGKVYVGGIAGEEVTPNPPPPEFGVQVLSMPKYTWWVQIKNSKGQVPWTDETKAFKHIDACE